MPTKKTKDLAPKPTAKVNGGGRRLNDNITLVRASSPFERARCLRALPGVRGAPRLT
jgi:hypothetical protein